MAGADVHELNSLAVSLTRASGTVGARAAVALRKTARDIEANAKAIAPVDTGNLKSSIGTDITGDGRHSAMEAVIGPTAAYGVHLEFGTSRMAPRAFMGPSLDRFAPGFEAAVAQIAEQAL